MAILFEDIIWSSKELDDHEEAITVFVQVLPMPRKINGVYPLLFGDSKPRISIIFNEFTESDPVLLDEPEGYEVHRFLRKMKFSYFQKRIKGKKPFLPIHGRFRPHRNYRLSKGEMIEVELAVLEVLKKYGIDLTMQG